MAAHHRRSQCSRARPRVLVSALGTLAQADRADRTDDPDPDGGAPPVTGTGCIREPLAGPRSRVRKRSAGRGLRTPRAGSGVSGLEGAALTGSGGHDGHSCTDRSGLGHAEGLRLIPVLEPVYSPDHRRGVRGDANRGEHPATGPRGCDVPAQADRGQRGARVALAESVAPARSARPRTPVSDRAVEGGRGPTGAAGGVHGAARPASVTRPGRLDGARLPGDARSAQRTDRGGESALTGGPPPIIRG